MPSKTWYARNKEKAKAYNEQWRKNNRSYDLLRKRAWYYQKGRERNLLKLYGLTTDQYDIILEYQKYSCAICGSKDKLVVDHNHETTEVRGLLCYDCNRNFIGNNNDYLKYERAADYLKHCWRHGQREKV